MEGEIYDDGMVVDILNTWTEQRRKRQTKKHVDKKASNS